MNDYTNSTINIIVPGFEWHKRHGLPLTSTTSVKFEKKFTSIPDTSVGSTWLRLTVVKGWSLTSELSLSCARFAADG